MATPDDLEDWIRTENEEDDSVADQVTVAKWFWKRDITTLQDRVARTSQVSEGTEHRLDHQARTCLDNLEEIGILVQFDPPGSGRYIRHHRSGENFYDPSTREFVPLLEEDLSRFLDDLASRSEPPLQRADGGDDEAEVPSQTLRIVARDALNVDEEDVRSALTSPDDPIERMNRYDSVVNAIKDSDDVSRNRDYDEMGWRNSALRWSLSERAAHLQANQSLPT
jgi:hypothetical protein